MLQPRKGHMALTRREDSVAWSLRSQGTGNGLLPTERPEAWIHAWIGLRQQQSHKGDREKW